MISVRKINQGYGIGGHLVQTEFFTDNINDGGLQEKHVRLAKKLFDSQ